MHIKGVDLPDALIKARDNGELVVFAGAGVSIPSPSSLPTFTKLADQIGQGSSPRAQKEPEDKYLGRLYEAGVDVHRAAAKILVGPHTLPNELHFSLVKLFHRTPVRLVTTNFDTHFSTASTSLNRLVERFYAPALPLGDDFEGLVYLHGSAHDGRRKFVLTDRDFGAAYLTRGWATEFLKAMFMRYNVLFIGYSHRDTVMDYLARGLPPTSVRQRFAFCPSNDQDVADWKFRGIHPIKYEKTPSDPHSDLRVCVAEWAGELERGIFEKAQRIRSLAKAEPPIDEADADYVVLALNNESLALHFFSQAKNPKWIEWMEGKKLLDALFNPVASLTETESSVGNWLCRTFCASASVELFSLIQRKGNILNRGFAWFISRELIHRDKHPEINPVFGAWLALLLTQPRSILSNQDWCFLLESCQLPNERHIAIVLFQFLTTPILQLEQPFTFEGDRQVRFSVNLNESAESSLLEFAENISPHIGELAEPLIAIAVGNLENARSLLLISGQRSSNYDPFWISRQSIAHPDESFLHIIDVLVDICTSAFNWINKKNPAAALEVARRWSTSATKIVQRLGIFGIGRNNAWTSDQKIDWLLSRDLLYEFKTDVFEFLELTYGNAESATRERVIARGLQGIPEERAENLEERTRAYEIYNLFVWLNQLAPECSSTKAAFTALQATHTDFGPRDHPQLDHWSGGVQSRSPDDLFDIAKIASNPPESFLDEILKVSPKSPLDLDSSDYLGAVVSIVAKNPKWGLAWVSVLRDRAISGTEFWEVATRGWSNAALSDEDWSAVFGSFGFGDAPSAFREGFIHVLHHGCREPTLIPEGLIESAQAIADWCWGAMSKRTGSPVKSGDWLGTAINRDGGRLARFYLYRLRLLRKKLGEDWHGIPVDLLDRINAILASPSEESTYFRIVIATQLHYFLSLDRSFAESVVLPWFSWEKNVTIAEQSWDGFLYWGRWPAGISERLLDDFLRAIEVFHSRREGEERIFNQIAPLIIFVIENPLIGDWLPKVFAVFSDAQKTRFAQHLAWFLREIDAVIMDRIWERWLRAFLEMRFLGKPSPLTKDESSEWAISILSLDQKLPEAAQLLGRVAQFVGFARNIFLHRMNERKTAQKHPEEASDLLLLYFGSSPKHFYPKDDLAEIWKDLKLAGATPAKMQQIREDVFRMSAVDLDSPDNQP